MFFHSSSYRNISANGAIIAWKTRNHLHIKEIQVLDKLLES